MQKQQFIDNSKAYQYYFADLWNFATVFFNFVLYMVHHDPVKYKFLLDWIYHPSLKDPELLRISFEFYHTRGNEFTQQQLFLSQSRFSLFITPILEIIHSAGHGNTFESHVMHFLSTLFSLLIYIHLDQLIEQNFLKLKEKDLKIAKVVHDLKNPILSIKQIINNQDFEENLDNKNSIQDQKFILDIQKQINAEIEDVEEMIENLKTEFKSKSQMKFREEIKEILSTEFLESFKNTHTKLTERSKNQLKLIINPRFPVQIEIAKSMVKRILNNFISNSLKHTTNGEVELNFKMMSNNQLLEQSSQYQQGSELKSSDSQFCFEVKDNGIGISKERLSMIFMENESDEAGENWDGCGLGLPICSKLSESLGARIFYNSVHKKTTFLLVMNISQTLNEYSRSDAHSKVQSDHQYNNTITEPYIITLDCRINELATISHKHNCNSIIIAEDNSNILKRYTKQMDKNSIPYKAFLNGSDCLSQVLDDLVQNCTKCKDRLIITDMHMPFMDGEELARQVRIADKFNKYKLVLLSADEPSLEFKAKSLFDKIQVKPFNFKYFNEYYDLLKQNNDFDTFNDKLKELVKVKQSLF